MKITKLLRDHDFNKSLLIGYYGGGNFGDELLLEVLLNMFKKQGVTQLDVVYQEPQRYKTYHHDFGCQLVTMRDKFSFLRALLRSKNVVVGGGGMWGLDVNMHTLLLGIVLWVSRWVLGKNVFLLGVGYYQSTSWLGRVSAWLSAKAAHHIVVRDTESHENFAIFTHRVSLDKDIAWYTRQLDLSQYDPEADRLAADMALPESRSDRTLFITLRRFKPQYANDFTHVVEAFIAAHPKRHMVVALLEPRQVDPEGYALLSQWAKKYVQIHITDFAYNPLALLVFFQKNHKQLAFMGPQFHGLLVAHLAGVPYLPLVYDNKSRQLLEQVAAPENISIYDVTMQHLQQFAREAGR